MTEDEIIANAEGRVSISKHSCPMFSTLLSLNAVLFNPETGLPLPVGFLNHLTTQCPGSEGRAFRPVCTPVPYTFVANRLNHIGGSTHGNQGRILQKGLQMPSHRFHGSSWTEYLRQHGSLMDISSKLCFRGAHYIICSSMNYYLNLHKCHQHSWYPYHEEFYTNIRNCILLRKELVLPFLNNSIGIDVDVRMHPF